MERPSGTTKSIQPAMVTLNPVLSATFTWFLGTSRHSTIALGSLAQSLAKGFVRKFSLMSNLTFPWHNLRLLLMEGETILWIILNQLDKGIWKMNQRPRKWLKRYQQLLLGSVQTFDYPIQ